METTELLLGQIETIFGLVTVTVNITQTANTLDHAVIIDWNPEVTLGEGIEPDVTCFTVCGSIEAEF